MNTRVPRPASVARTSERWTVAWVLLAVLVAACNSQPPSDVRPMTATTSEVAAVPSQPLFVDVSEQVGLDFVHINGASGELYSAEIMGSGAAWLDIEGDGDLDLFLVQGNHRAMQAEAAVAGGSPPPLDRLLRNELIPTGELRFTDVTDRSGIVGDGYGMGVAVGDVDRDGDDDLYVTVFGGPDRLWLSAGDGTFVDRTLAAGLGETRWTTSATFADLDGDGWLDLAVAVYLRFRFDAPPCFGGSSARDYCGPASYPPEVDLLYRNLGLDAAGQVRFADVTDQAGLGRAAGAGLGVVAADFDGDDHLDLFVANDADDNRLWRRVSEGEFRFEDTAVLSGCATNGMGQREGSMGIAVGDVDRDGDEDIFVTHLDGETDTFYGNAGDGTFRDRSRATGLAAPGLPYTSFGTGFLDVDNDGWLDLAVVSGAVRLWAGRSEGEGTLAQPDRIFLQRPDAAGGTRFVDAGELGQPATSRGLALGDVDNDGDLDLLVTDNGGPARLLLNQVGQAAPWLGFRVLEGWGSPALGARVGVHRRQGPSLWRRVAADGSYLSAHDSRLTVGLGDDAEVTSVEVRWLDGTVETFPALELGRYHLLQRRSGED